MTNLVALVGTKYRGREAMEMLASLPVGTALVLKRDPANAHDPQCVEVWARGVHIGFLKKEQNGPVSARMDAAEAVVWLDRAKLAIDGGKWPMVEIEE